jgi:predicted GNAT family acetyltransferase
VKAPAFFMTVTNNTQKQRYELDSDGHLAIAEYRLTGNQIAITHIFVPESLRGKRVAAQVMKGVVDDANAKKLSIIPVCPYAAAYLKKNPQ